MPEIRPLHDPDWPAAWAIIEPVFRAGETYGVAPDITEDAAYRKWVTEARNSYVAIDEAAGVVGTYFLKPNYGGPGSHVANCGYIVAEGARGQGLATAMCRHSQRAAVAAGFRAMQYNFVVATNEPAIRVWQREGFHIAGTLPGAFNHPRHGLVDAYVMFRTLV
jgi:ribosomal protein S18 acetylase RimI-like enzyme